MAKSMERTTIVVSHCGYVLHVEDVYFDREGFRIAIIIYVS